HYSAGVMAFSPSLRWEELLATCDTPHSNWDQPAVAGLQGMICDRMRCKHHPEPSGSLRRLIECEFAHTELPTLDDVRDAYTFLRLMPHGNLPAYDKLEAPRVPTLIVQAANDPLVPAQALADLMAGTKNPMVAALMLPKG